MFTLVVSSYIRPIFVVRNFSFFGPKFWVESVSDRTGRIQGEWRHSESKPDVFYPYDKRDKTPNKTLKLTYDSKRGKVF